MVSISTSILKSSSINILIFFLGESFFCRHCSLGWLIHYLCIDVCFLYPQFYLMFCYIYSPTNSMTSAPSNNPIETSTFIFSMLYYASLSWQSIRFLQYLIIFISSISMSLANSIAILDLFSLIEGYKSIISYLIKQHLLLISVLSNQQNQ